MLRSDASMLMRSTLEMSRIFRDHRNMQPLMRNATNELNLMQWLKNLEKLEDLDEQMHETMAKTFLVRLLDHDGKKAVLSRNAVDDTRKTPTKKKKESGSAIVAPGERAISIKGQLYVLGSLMKHHEQFLQHLHPLTFLCPRPQEQRANPALDYKLGVILHTGIDAKHLRTRLKWCVSAVERLREATAKKFDLADPRHMRTRIVLITWGQSFHPVSGAAYRRLVTLVKTMNTEAVAKGTGLSFEMFSVYELLFDATQHDSVPALSVVRNRDEHPRLKFTKDHELPYINLSDKQARIRDLQPGQVVRVERKDFILGGTTHDYRVVVEDS